ncbi:MAG: hypothetical protein U0570_09390 [Phycisphaerales bacterium]
METATRNGEINFAGGVGGAPGGGLQRTVLYRNVAQQWVYFRLLDLASTPIDAAAAESMTVRLTGANTADDPESTVEVTNEPVFFRDGVYGVQLTQAESNFDTMVLSVEHSFGKVSPVVIETTPHVPSVTIQPDSLTLQN